MKKTFLLMLLLMLTTGTLVWAQGDSKIETGIISFQAGDFKKALDFLNEGLKDPALVKPKNLPRAYYHRGLCRIRVMATTAQGIQGEPTKEQAEALEGMLLGAFEDYKLAKKTDDGKWGKKVDEAMQNLNVSFLQGALAALNMTYGKDVTPGEKAEAYQAVVEMTNYSTEIDVANYFPFDLRAQGKLGLKDSLGALADFATAAKLIEANTHSRPDLLIGYTYYRKAILERYTKHDVDAALATIEVGKKVLEKEWAKIVAKKVDTKPDEFAKSEKTYLEAKEDLDKFELDLLLNAPEKLQQAIDKFKSAIVSEPKNYVLHVAYAQLLEKVGKNDDAASVYESATKIDPSKQMAWFNLGAMYVNKAVALYAEANKIQDNPGKAKELQTQGVDLFKKALPYLQKANEIDKCDGDTLRALLQLTINLELTDEYKKYKDIEKACKAGQ